MGTLKDAMAVIGEQFSNYQVEKQERREVMWF